MTPYLFVGPFVIMFMLFTVAPIGLAIWKSLFRVPLSGLGFDQGQRRVFVGLANYGSALSQREFVDSFLRVLLFGVVQVPVMLGLALLFALLFDSFVTRFKGVLQMVVFLPYAVPTVIAALMWAFLYQPGVSPIVNGLHGLGIPVNFLAPKTVLWSIANISTWSFTGINMIILYAALQGVPRDVYEAARLDGAGQIRTAWSVKIPMIVPALFLTLLFSIIGNLQLFNEPAVVRQITANVGAYYTPNMSIFEVTTKGGNPYLGSAMAVIVGLVAVIISALAGLATRRVRQRASS